MHARADDVACGNGDMALTDSLTDSLFSIEQRLDSGGLQVQLCSGIFFFIILEVAENWKARGTSRDRS
jgi:hypothetical protein